MLTITTLEFQSGSKEERLPDFSPEFPHIASCSEFSQRKRLSVPWHWHKPVELFYVKNGLLEYHTPAGKRLFPAGSGGMINSNVLHMTNTDKEIDTIQVLHIFDPSFISGKQGSLIEQKYVTPLVASTQMEVIALYPDVPEQAEILDLIRDSFQLSEKELGYEKKLRNILSEIWMELFKMVHSTLTPNRGHDKSNSQIKSMMAYIHEHYSEKISIADLASVAFSSERECFRIFRDCLHMTPMEYMKSYRLQMACQMLAEENDSITTIAHSCGLGSSSYFGKQFREEFDCTPLEYRHKWQDCDR